MKCMAWILAVAIGGGAAASAETMPFARQNALVQKYCAVCHTDASNNGGLTLEHFDAGRMSPSLAAMLLSKVTGGASLETSRTVDSDPDAAAWIERSMTQGAMGAAGLPIPDKATIFAFIQSLAAESAGATDWAIERAKDEPRVVASVLRELAPAHGPGLGRVFRLIVSCDPSSREGSLQLAWSPLPKKGTLALSIDGKAHLSYQVDGAESMGNGSKVVTQGLAAYTLTGIPLPAESLTMSELFPEAVSFSFDKLPAQTRRDLQGCFPVKRVALQ